jgi:L-fuconate dehydratase
MVDIVQIDSARVGGVGLCEMVQHLSMFDYIAVSGTVEDRVIEYVDHLHEHFVDSLRVADGHYLAPTVPELSAQMHPESLKEFTYPDGPVWSSRV